MCLSSHGYAILHHDSTDKHKEPDPELDPLFDNRPAVPAIAPRFSTLNGSGDDAGR